jgi:hypothetical protein
VAAPRTWRRRHVVGYNMTIHRIAALSVIASIVVMMSAPAAAAVPTLTVTPSAGPGGTVVTVSGAAFCPPPCSTVEVDVGGIPASRQVAVVGAGRFHLTFAIRNSATGGVNAIYAEQRDASGSIRSASTTFRVTPSTRPKRTISARVTTTPSPGASTAGPQASSSTSPRPDTTQGSPSTPAASPAATTGVSSPPSPTAVGQGHRATSSPWWWLAAVLVVPALGYLGYAQRRRRSA